MRRPDTRKAPTALTHQHTKTMVDMVFGTLDIETAGFGGAFLGIGLYDGNAEHVVEKSQDIEAVILSLFDRPQKKWFFHNGARYDFNYLKPIFTKLIQMGYEVIPTVRGVADFITYSVYNNGATTPVFEIQDSFPAVPTTLDAFTKAFAPAYHKKGHCAEHPMNKGVSSYWNWECPVCQEYLSYDCLGLYYAIASYEQVLHEQFGINWHMTAGSIAKAAFKETLPEGVYYNHLRRGKEEDYWRASYHGGLVHIGKTIGNRGKVIGVDLHAAYAGIGMNGEFPTKTGIFTARYRPNYPIAVYHAYMTIPKDTPVVFIPHYKDDTKVWGTGSHLDCYVTGEDIVRGHELGYQFEVIDGFCYEHTTRVFDEFISKNERLEHEHPDIKDAAKNNRNSLYGLFGRRRVANTYAMLLNEPDDMTPLAKPYKKGEKLGQVIENMYYKEEEIKDDMILPHWAALITSRVRIAVSRKIEWLAAHGYDCYTDTDSVITDYRAYEEMIASGELVIGDRYGDWSIDQIRRVDGSKEDAIFEEFYVFGPKNYIGETLEENIKLKMKGVPFGIQAQEEDGSPQWTAAQQLAYVRQYFAGEDVTPKQLKKIRSIRHGKTMWIASDGKIYDTYQKQVKIEMKSESWRIEHGEFTHVHDEGENS